MGAGVRCERGTLLRRQSTPARLLPRHVLISFASLPSSRSLSGKWAAHTTSSSASAGSDGVPGNAECARRWVDESTCLAPPCLGPRSRKVQARVEAITCGSQGGRAVRRSAGRSPEPRGDYRDRGLHRQTNSPRQKPPESGRRVAQGQPVSLSPRSSSRWIRRHPTGDQAV